MALIDQSRIDTVLNDVVYALFARCGAQSAAATGKRDGRLGKIPLVDHPAEVDQIVKNPGAFRKNFSFISALGHSRFNANGDEWAVRRDITQDRYLSAARPARQQDIAQAYVEHLAGCEATLPDIQKAIFAASLSIFYHAFGLIPDLEPTVLLLDRARAVLRRLQYHSWVAPTNEERDSSRQEAQAIIRDFRGHLLADGAAAAEMDRFAEAGRKIDGFSSSEEFVINLFAGVETTVATSLWVIDRLAANEEVQSRIFSEIAAGGETPFTDCFINETMRYFPPIPFLIREVVADMRLGSRDFPMGQLLLLSIVGVHHHPEFWEEPETFDSRRREFMEDSFDRRAFIPFLAGPRMCGGARLGRMEVREAVRALACRFSFRRTDNIVRFDYGLALRPATGSSIDVSRR